MIDLDRWQEIYLTLSHHKLRTALTAFGVFWGIFMLVVLLGAGNGLRNGALAGFGGHTNTIFIWTQNKTQIPYKGLNAGRWIRFNTQDLASIKRLPDVDLITDVNEVGGWQTQQYVVYKDKSGSFEGRGVAPDAFKLAGYRVTEGRAINDLDYQQRRKVVVLGKNAREVLFNKEDTIIGEHILISGVSFQVIGAFEPLISGQSGKDDSERILIPNTTLRHTFNQADNIGHFQVSPVAGKSAVDLEKRLRSMIMSNHFVHPDDQAVLGSFNSQEKFSKVQGLFSAIQSFSWLVAIGTVIAGVVGVGNIMLIVVKERTREIGVRKALGATSLHIIVTIVQESLVITVISGYLGLVAGVFALEGINALMLAKPSDAMFRNPEIDLGVAMLSLTVLIVAGLLASVLPASNAASVQPIVALQDE